MRVNLQRRRDFFMPQAVGDDQRGKAHFDEQRRMRVTQIVQTDDFDARFPCGRF